MKLKPLLLTVGLLGICVGGAVWWTHHRSAGYSAGIDERVGRALLDDADVEQLAEIFIIAEGQECTLNKSESGWIVPDHFGLPVDFVKLRSFVEGFKNAKVLRKLTANPEAMQRFDLNAHRVTFKSAEGNVLLDVNVGSTSQTGDRFVQFESQGPAYSMRFNGYLNGNPQAWVSHQLKIFEPDTIVQIELEGPELDRVVAVRTSADAPFSVEGLAENERVRQDVLQQLMRRLGSIRIKQYAALDSPSAAAARNNIRKCVFMDDKGGRYQVGLGLPPGELDAVGSADAEESDASSGPVYIFLDGSDDVVVSALDPYLGVAAVEVDEFLIAQLPSARDAVIETVAVAAENTSATDVDSESHSIPND